MEYSIKSDHRPIYWQLNIHSLSNPRFSTDIMKEAWKMDNGFLSALQMILFQLLSFGTMRVLVVLFTCFFLFII